MYLHLTADMFPHITEKIEKEFGGLIPEVCYTNENY